MTIEIISTKTLMIDGVEVSRHCDIIITSGATSYLWGVGGLPLTGDLQTILDAREAELWTAASAAAIEVPTATTYKQEAKQFLADNPNAKLLLDLDPATLESTIENRTAGQETLLLKTFAFAIRFLYEAGKD